MYEVRMHDHMSTRWMLIIVIIVVLSQYLQDS